MATLVLGGCGEAASSAPASSTAAPSAAALSAPAPFYATPFEKRPGVPAMTELGRRLFHDPSLSASGGTSCASCHDPARAYGPPNALPVQLAGADGKTPGLRAAPSLRYLHKVPPFTEHFFDADGDDSNDHVIGHKVPTLHDLLRKQTCFCT
jgi:cytochrome c peroxidase